MLQKMKEIDFGEIIYYIHMNILIYRYIYAYVTLLNA